ncbi:unnamed protein product [Rotaria magnacalcarata]|uniref:protein-serine/threonine phosphatase n=1 Tax=Rotaria magnacalcarata TaxID=392030 RepID=A0A819EWX7_9BILA|nr:unnamed protein product [Rotaria magnacalcarata]CAF3857693.1 unnamed protein product [Rotaria magnacalcarata]
MGAYLSSPICDKDTIASSNDRLAYAASSMQGWRMSQEDAHNAILDFDDKTSFFAVYDGHGGAEIALYCARHLPDFIKQLASYQEGRLKDALIEGFLKFDSLLLDPNVKEILQTLADLKDKNDDDEQIDDASDGVIVSTNASEELNVEEAQLLKKEAELPIEELLKRYGDDGKTFQSPMISKNKAQNLLKVDDKTTKNVEKQKELQNSETTDDNTFTPSVNPDQNKSDVITHSDEENIPADDVSNHKTAETASNCEISDSTEVKPSSSEPKTATKRPRKPVSNETTIPSSATVKSKSLTHHLLSENTDDLEDDDDEEDDSEYEESDDETSDDEVALNEEDDENVAGDEDQKEGEDDDEEEGTEEEEEEDDENENKKLASSKAAEIKKLMKKSIMAILNRHSKKKKHNDDSDDDAKENQNDDDEEEDGDDNEEEDDEDDDNDTELGKMLDMSSDPGSSSGCTAVVTLLRDKQLFVANAGDSRCVVCRNGRAIEMSIDHKPEDIEERTRIEKAGYKVTLDGRVSGGLNLSRAIGDHAYKKTAKLPPEEQAITALPDIRILTLEDQDEFMVIACDGIWNFMSSQDVVDFVRPRLKKKQISEICEELFMHCLAPNTSGDGTGCDNMTAIIVKFNFNKQSTTETSQELNVSKSMEHSPWPTMFTPVNNKRSLSPEHVATEEITNNDNTSKKFKTIPENGTDEVTSPSKTTGSFSFNSASTTNNNNSNDDQQH